MILSKTHFGRTTQKFQWLSQEPGRPFWYRISFEGAARPLRLAKPGAASAARAGQRPPNETVSIRWAGSLAGDGL